MTIDEILSIRDAAMATGDVKRYELAWVALGYHRHPGFLPATAQEREAAARKLSLTQFAVDM